MIARRDRGGRLRWAYFNVGISPDKDEGSYAERPPGLARCCVAKVFGKQHIVRFPLPNQYFTPGNISVIRVLLSFLFGQLVGSEPGKEMDVRCYL